MNNIRDRKKTPANFTSLAMRLNERLDRSMPFVTPVGVVCGFLFSDVFIVLRPYIPFLFAIMTLSGSLKLTVRELGIAVSRPFPVLVFFAGSHVFMPLAALALSGLLFSGQKDIVAGFVLLFSTPTAVAGFIWVSIFGGDGALTLAIILLDALLAPIVVPATVSLLLGTSVQVDSLGMLVSLSTMVVFPTVAGIALNEWSGGSVPRAVGPYVGSLAKFCLAAVVAGNAAAVAPMVDFSSSIVSAVALSAVGLSAFGFVLGKLLGSLPGMDKGSRRSLVFAIGLRNISAASTLAISYFPAAAALPATLGIIFQQMIAALMGKVLIRSEPPTLKRKKEE